MADIVPGDAKWMKNALDEEGRQSFVQGRLKPLELHKKLMMGGDKAWSERFTAKLKPECGGLCVLECKRCKADLSPANPSETNRRHKCTTAALAAVEAAGGGSSKGEGSSSKKHAREEQEVEEVDCIGQPDAKKRKMAAFTVTPAQHKQFHRLFAVHLIKERVPFLKVECPALRKALAVLGLDLKGEKAFRVTLLNALHEECREQVFAEVKGMLESPKFAGIVLCSDGWKRKACMQGTPLVNVLVLKPDGGCIFLKVIEVTEVGLVKNAPYIAQQQEEFAIEAAGGDPNKVLMVLMENPSANRSAMKLIEEEHPRWMAMGCNAHALNLAIKDFCNPKKASGVAGVLNQAQRMSMVVGDNATIRAALHEMQHKKYGKIKAISLHCPTRWGIMVMIVEDLLDTEDAVRGMVESPEWKDLAESSANKGCFNACKTPEWWRKLKGVHQLVEPFKDAIHKLEADLPLLSQVHPTYDALEAHVSKWAARADLTQALRKDVVNTFKARRLKHYHPAQPASYILDPTNFEAQGSSVRSPINRITAQHRQDLVDLVARLNGGKDDMDMSSAVSKELCELDLGDWDLSMAEAGAFLKKRDYSAEPSQLQILSISKPDYARNFWLYKADKQFPLLAYAANKLLSAHATTAAAERNWSAFGSTYTALRNRLTTETAEKLVNTRANMPAEWYS